MDDMPSHDGTPLPGQNETPEDVAVRGDPPGLHFRYKHGRVNAGSRRERTFAMPMNNPPHPGEIVREECLAPLGLSVTDGARALGVSRQAVALPSG